MLNKLLLWLDRLRGRKPSPHGESTGALPKIDVDTRLLELLPVLSTVGIAPDARELADVLWLAAHLNPVLPQVRQGHPPAEQPKPDHGETKPKPQDGIRQGDRQAAKPQPSTVGKAKLPSQSKVYPKAGQTVGQRPAAGFRAPSAPALEDALGLARALRPLRRKVPSRTRRRIDEEATAEGIAAQRLAGHRFWIPALVPATEPWFELALVIDSGSTMVVWGSVLDEFRSLLDYSGAFQRVRVFTLNTDGPEPLLRAGSDPSRGRLCRPNVLTAMPSRCLLLLVSDCVGRAWHAKTLNTWLRRWGGTAPLAVLQMLPRRLWEGTGLGRGEFQRLFSRVEAPTSNDLERGDAALTRLLGQKPPIAGDELRFPVLTLEPTALRGWGRLLAGRRDAWCTGAGFGADTRYASEFEWHAAKSPNEAAVEQRYADFLAEASPPARKLAGLLAAAPLTLPIMRLVQRSLLPMSSQTHLAEIIISGLLRRHPELDVGGATPFYDFRGDIRRRLLDLIGERESKQVLVQVSAFVSERTGQALDFAALLATPMGSGLANAGLNLDDANTRHFAEIGAIVLGRLGGRYAELAKELTAIATGESSESVAAAKSVVPDIPQPDGPTPFRDLFSGQKTEGPAMVWLPGGIFMMGSPDGVGNDNEHPQHEVTLDHYAVGQYPVTVGEFSRFVEETGYRTEAEQGDGAFVRNKGSWAQTKDASWRNPYFDQTDQNPVVCISWNDAKAYCDWLVEQTGQAYGLLTEAQWEYACRGGNEGRWCFGDNESDLGDYAWYSKNANNQTHPVGQKKPNAWQLHDMHGNVWEWCEDWYDGEYYRNLGKVTLLPDLPLTSKPQHTASASEQSASGSASEHEQRASENPSGPASGSCRVVRGGSWLNVAGLCRSAYRYIFDPSIRFLNFGFRLSRTGPLHSYPFTLGSTELEKPAVPAFIAGLRDPFTDGSESPAMVWLPGGEFMMGQDDSPYDDEKPAHPVRVDAISIGQYPVTFAEYDRFCSATQRKPPDDRSWGRGERPAINVSWQDAMDYCDWLGQQTGEHYRLATEAEWEYACRSGSTTRYCYGDDESGLGDYAWYSKNANSQTHPVGQKKPNAWQLYDLHGNVWDWCADWYSGDYYAQLAGHSQHTASASEQSASGSASGREQLASENPSGPASGSNRVVRGGSWHYVADYCRSAIRNLHDPSSRYDLIGFRLSRTGPWRSHPITLGRAVEASPEFEEALPLDSSPRGAAPTSKPRFQDYEVFHDSLASDAKGGEAPAMVYLPGGTFLMGDEKGSHDEKPVHPVRLSAFAMGRTPVTIGEYLKFCQATDSHWPEWLEPGSQYHLETGKSDHYRRPGISREGLDLPVVGIAWKDANAYCLWLSGQTGEVYALPTEAQWEYACRAGNPGRWCFGDDEKQLAEYAWYSGNAGGKLHPVMGKAANGFGLYDVHGNVREWCEDWYASDYYEQLAGHSQHTASASEQSASGSASGREQLASENPSGPASGSYRVVRGGSWFYDADLCRSAYRDYFDPSLRIYYLGFRLSRTV